MTDNTEIIRFYAQLMRNTAMLYPTLLIGDGQVKTTGGVRLNGGKSGQMAFQTRADRQNQAIGWLQKEWGSLGGAAAVQIPRI